MLHIIQAPAWKPDPLHTNPPPQPSHNYFLLYIQGTLLLALALKVGNGGKLWGVKSSNMRAAASLGRFPFPTHVCDVAFCCFIFCFTVQLSCITSLRHYSVSSYYFQLNYNYNLRAELWQDIANAEMFLLEVTMFFCSRMNKVYVFGSGSHSTIICSDKILTWLTWKISEIRLSGFCSAVWGEFSHTRKIATWPKQLGAKSNLPWCFYLLAFSLRAFIQPLLFCLKEIQIKRDWHGGKMGTPLKRHVSE